MDVLAIGVAALLTSILSALAGLGGGIILLVVIAQFFAPTVAIPIQGGIQLVSNGSRAAILRTNIAWRPVAWSSLLLLPASFLGVAVATSIPEDAMRFVMGVFVLVVAWRPAMLKWRGGRELPDQALLAVGAVSGFVNSTVGASGPFTSPFFKAVTATHSAFVATAAATQVLAHVSKLIAFSANDFSIGDHVDVILVGAVGVTVGSWFGTRLLGRVSETHLDMLFKIVLSLLAVRLIGRALLGW